MILNSVNPPKVFVMSQKLDTSPHQLCFYRIIQVSLAHFFFAFVKTGDKGAGTLEGKAAAKKWREF